MLTRLRVGPHKFARILTHCLDHIAFSGISKVEQLAFKIPKEFCAVEHKNHKPLNEKIKWVAETPVVAFQEGAESTAETMVPKLVESLDKPQVNEEVDQLEPQRLSSVDIISEADNISQLAKNMRVSEIEIPRRFKALLVEDNKINMKVRHLLRFSVLLTNGLDIGKLYEALQYRIRYSRKWSRGFATICHIATNFQDNIHG